MDWLSYMGLGISNLYVEDLTVELVFCNPIIFFFFQMDLFSWSYIILNWFSFSFPFLTYIFCIETLKHTRFVQKLESCSYLILISFSFDRCSCSCNCFISYANIILCNAIFCFTFWGPRIRSHSDFKFSCGEVRNRQKY